MEKYKKLLEERKSNGLFRSLSSFSFKEYTDFCSNDYLGYSQIEFDSDIDFNAATGSRLISGNHSLYDTTEVFLAEFFEADAALLFNSGFDANLGLFSSVPQKGDTIIYDELIHASIRDGIRLSNAKSFKFLHNDLKDLEAKIKKSEGEVFIAVESVYSMDGDFSPLIQISELTQKYQAKLIVDEAHSAGLWGAGGRGLSVELGIQNVLFARIVTFGKAYGSHGAVVLGSKDLRDFLINFARSFIYTTALPNTAIERIANVVNQGKYDHTLRAQLFKNIELFVDLFASLESYQIKSESAIQTFVFPGNEVVKSLEKTLLNEKIWCKAILSPTVPEGKERLRVSLHSFNTKEEFLRLKKVITNFS